MDEKQREKSNLDDSAVLESITSQWWSFSSLVPLLTGALWLWLAAGGGLARGGARRLATEHGTLGAPVGRRNQDVPVHGARLRPRDDSVFARDPAHRTPGRARTRSGFGGKLPRGGLPGHGPAPLSSQS